METDGLLFFVVDNNISGIVGEPSTALDNDIINIIISWWCVHCIHADNRPREHKKKPAGIQGVPKSVGSLLFGDN